MALNISPVVWHASRADIDRPTLLGRTVGDNHANSGLGIFCATEADPYIAGFGDFIFELHLKENPKVFPLTIPQLREMGYQDHIQTTREWFEEKGKALSSEYDLIALVEISGNVDQVILLRDDVVESVVKHSVENFKQSFSQQARHRRNARI